MLPYRTLHTLGHRPDALAPVAFAVAWLSHHPLSQGEKAALQRGWALLGSQSWEAWPTLAEASERQPGEGSGKMEGGAAAFREAMLSRVPSPWDHLLIRMGPVQPQLTWHFSRPI